MWLFMRGIFDRLQAERAFPPSRVDHVLIAGAGFSGTLQAINLLLHSGTRVTLIERRDIFGPGIAYSTSNPAHLLNVRASNMSALPDKPEHFVRWLQDRGHDLAQPFASRQDYGAYLGHMLEKAMRDAPGRLDLVRDDVTSLHADHAGVSAKLASGRQLSADAAVLALGNLPPHDPLAMGDLALPEDLYVRDPWTAGDIAADLTSEDRVLIIGTSLTMVDVVLSLQLKGFCGHITAMSRHGLLPRIHATVNKASSLSEKPALFGSKLLRFIRARATDIGWRAAIDELRPYTQAMWLSAPFEEQRRFLRHLRPWWDVHRHRIAPSVSERIEAKRHDGMLNIIAGSILRIIPEHAGVGVHYRERHGNNVQRMVVRRIINCTGPQGDLLRTSEPLLRQLTAAGHIRPDPHRFGVQVNAQAETIDAQGRANPRLLALGPLTRGTFWEIVAVPDIRVQTWSLARRLSNAHWVGGEGL